MITGNGAHVTVNRSRGSGEITECKITPTIGSETLRKISELFVYSSSASHTVLCTILHPGLESLTVLRGALPIYRLVSSFPCLNIRRRLTIVLVPFRSR